MASDAYIARKAQDFIDSLSEEDRLEWDAALWRFLDDPFSSDGRSVPLDFPYPAGTFGHSAGKFWFTFVVANAEVIWIPHVQFRPGALPAT